MCFIANEWFNYLSAWMHAISYICHRKSAQLIDFCSIYFIVFDILQVASSIYITKGLKDSIERLFMPCVDEDVQGDKAGDALSLSHLICLPALFMYNHGFYSCVDLQNDYYQHP